MSHGSNAEKSFEPARVFVLTISDTRILENDRSGDLLVQRLEEAGHTVVGRKIVTDEKTAIREQVEQAISQMNLDVIIATGGTGFATRDVTPDAISPLFNKHIPGFGELFRMLSYQEIGSSTIQSRADAGLCGQTLLFLLPGSTGACRLAMDKIILDQIDNRHRPCNFRDILGP